MKTDSYPFATELITDTEGHISKVVLAVEDYQHLIEMLEDQGLIIAIKEAAGEKPLNREEALRELEE